MQVDLSSLFAAYDRVQAEKQRRTSETAAPRNALQAFLHSTQEIRSGSGFQRMERCR